VLVDPLLEVACAPGVLEDEHGCALHAVLDDGAHRAARLVDDLHPPVVRRDQGSLCGRQGDQELALRVLASHVQRSGETDGHLRDADEALDVAVGDVGIERVLRDVPQHRAGLSFEVPLPSHDDLVGVVVVVVTWDPLARRRRHRHHVAHRELELPERLAAELDRQRVLSLGQGLAGDAHADHCPQRERHAIGSEDLGAEHVVLELEHHVAERDLPPVDREPVDCDQGCVEHPVLDLEAVPVIEVAEAADGVQVPEDGRVAHDPTSTGVRGVIVTGRSVGP
jgi:hypothetical protein